MPFDGASRAGHLTAGRQKKIDISIIKELLYMPVLVALRLP